MVFIIVEMIHSSLLFRDFLICYKLNEYIFSVRDADQTSIVDWNERENGFDFNNNDQVTDLVFSFVRKFVDKIYDESWVKFHI